MKLDESQTSDFFHPNRPMRSAIVSGEGVGPGSVQAVRMLLESFARQHGVEFPKSFEVFYRKSGPHADPFNLPTLSWRYFTNGT